MSKLGQKSKFSTKYTMALIIISALARPVPARHEPERMIIVP